MRSWRIVAQGSLIGILGVAVLGSTLTLAGRDDYAFLDPLIDVKHALSQRYVDEPDAAALQEGAIAGMLEVLNDPYTVYVPAPDRDEFTKSLTGEYVGIGAQIIVRDGWLTIVTPLDDSPSLRAGLEPDDRVVAIDGEDAQGISGDEAVERLTGEPGTTVTLTIERSGERLEVPITRAAIKTVPVKGFHREGDQGAWRFMLDHDSGIGYIRLAQFTPGVSPMVADALQHLGARDGALKGLIIDVRWNPGGVMQEATAIADMFLDSGVIVSTRGRATREEIIRATPDDMPDFPIVVLINEQSASASEILAGALVENDRAIALGTRTVGKGSVQSVLTLPHGNGAQLKITEARYYLPSGRSLQRNDESAAWGVDPTPGFFVPMSREQALAAARVRQAEEVIRADRPAGESPTDWSDADEVLARLDDVQLSAAVGVLRDRLASGVWTPRSDAQASMDDLALSELRRAERTREVLLRELERVGRQIDALAQAAPADTEPADFDLWPDDAEVDGGVLRVLSASGEPIAELRITGGTLERWLIDAGVEPIEPAAEDPG